MPIGSIGVLWIRRTLAGGFLCGAISGLGSAAVDALYSAIAFCGLDLCCVGIFIIVNSQITSVYGQLANVTAADGQKSPVLSSRLIAAAAFCRYV